MIYAILCKTFSKVFNSAHHIVRGKSGGAFVWDLDKTLPEHSFRAASRRVCGESLACCWHRRATLYRLSGMCRWRPPGELVALCPVRTRKDPGGSIRSVCAKSHRRCRPEWLSQMAMVAP
eukprot:5880942-Amphidinium_carterae.1